MSGGLGQLGGSTLKQRTLHAPCTEPRAPTGPAFSSGKPAREAISRTRRCPKGPQREAALGAGQGGSGQDRAPAEHRR